VADRRAVDGGIQGVASSSELEPLKKANFPKRWKDFEQAKTYRDWVFQYIPRPVTTRSLLVHHPHYRHGNLAVTRRRSRLVPQGRRGCCLQANQADAQRIMPRSTGSPDR